MLNFKEKLNKIKILLGAQVELEDAKLKTGEIVSVENWEVGSPVLLVNTDGTKSPLIAGDYFIEDGTPFTVDENGIITEIKPGTPETPVGESCKQDVTKQALESLLEMVKELRAEMETYKSKLNVMNSSIEKFESTPGATKAPKTTYSNEKVDPLDAKLEALKRLKEDNFFKNK